ncbi:MAG: prolipoprotein diacylglyceryl transferase [Parcubacteria group bacterium]|nr:prolipoprotein diacylglyceryl transferase [Parcubacteria group bacterium]
MIPYLKFESFQVGPLTIYVWGIFVVIGILTGFFLLHRRGFFKEEKNLNLILYILMASIIGGRLGHVLFYDLSYFLENPADVIKIWEGGMSSLGGFLAVALVLLIALPKGQKLKYLDILTIPFIVTWIIARMGCFMIHDHVGRLSDFFLAVQFPAGARHDMALYEILVMVALLIILCAYKNVPRHVPTYIITILYYSVARFFLDFLRATDLSNPDPRYFGLTPAQYGMIFFFVVGVYLLIKNKKIDTKIQC